MVGRANVQVSVKSDSFRNNGTYLDSTGTLNIKGAMVVNGSGITRLHDFTVNHPDSSKLNSLVSVYHTANLVAGGLNANNNLYIRSDDNLAANLVVSGVLTNNVQGIIARASVTTGACPGYTSNFTLDISGPVVVFQWQSSTDSTTWSNISGATNATYTAMPAGTTFYRCHLTTNNSTYNQATPGIKLTVSGSLPSAGVITGASSVCAGSVTTLSDTATGGSWTSSNTAVATIGTTGIVSGIVAGTTVISYLVSNACGNASATRTVLVNPLPDAGSISGASSICVSANITLTNSSSGGVWSASNSNATVSGGVVTGLIAGIDTIIYTVTNLCGSASSSKTIVINPLPLAGIITGLSNVCPAATITLTNATSGGVWSSSNTARATVTGGVVSGVSAGTTTISYTVTNSCGSASSTKVVTVDPSPNAGTISGASSVGLGASTTLSDAALGGIWGVTTGNTSVSLGLVTGLNLGPDTITYTVTNVCGTAIATKPISVINSLSGIIGVDNICAGTSTTLSDTGTGVWTSSSPSIATIGASTGVVTGVYPGITTITYTSTGGFTTMTMTVNAAPYAITGGASTICEGSTNAYTESTTGGIWTSSNTAVASIGSTGIATGVLAGTAIISYTISTGCYVTTAITVNPSPAAIGGPGSVCVGQTITLTNIISGGIWSSSSPTIASIGSVTGIVSGLAGGLSTTISYTLGSGCYAIMAESVNALAAISGATSVCQGQSTILTNTVPGGIWSSTDATVSVGSTTGAVTSVSGGTASISYVLPSGCTATFNIIINPITPITGPTSVCVGQTIVLSNASVGGTWNSSAPSVASVGSTGIVTGGAGGLTAIIGYTLGTGCSVNYTITVNALAVISGATSVCQGQAISLSNAVPGGTWSSPSANVSVGSSTGIVTGIASGTATVSYILPSGCTTSAVVLVNPIAPITGPTSVCAGQTITLIDVSPGGTWSSSAPTVATVGSTGVVLGVTGNLTAIIGYTLGTGCSVNYTITVNPSAAITVPSPVCQSQTITLTNTVPGGTWSSVSPAVASVGSSSGIVTGVSGGTALISYVLPTGCLTTASVLVNPIAVVTGPSAVCLGQTITLSDATIGGTWSSSNVIIATVGSSSGVVTGMAGGLTVAIAYTMPTGCSASITVTVNPLAPIVGLQNVCLAQSISLSNSVPGGRWISSSTGIANVGSTNGIVNGVSAGTTTISYLLPTGCLATTTINVGSLSPITGPSRICVGQPVNLSNLTPGGTWQSSAPTIATVGSTGIVTGIASGLTANIFYTITASCRATKVVTVSALTASSVPGTIPICVGTTTLASNATSGGIWSSSNTSVAMVGSSGLITGVSAGSATISYALSTGCTALLTITVNPLSPITGPGRVCLGNTITLNDATPGGTWMSGASSATIASIGLSTGVVTGLAANLVAILTYTLPTGCKAYLSVSVNPIPSAPASIVGASSVSISGSTITLTDATTGGTWSSSNTSKATVGSSTGVVSGVGIGSAVITYIVTNASGCTNIATKVITVGPANPNNNTNSLSLDQVQLSGGKIALIPNPNNGEFTIKGKMASTTDEDVTIEVVDILGQSVYNGKVIAIAGKINEQVALNNTLANGMYLFNLYSKTEHYIFHFVLER